MAISACSICGYDNPAPPCSHCGSAPRAEWLRKAPVDGSSALGVGLEAIPVGLRLLWRTPGAYKLLIPPLLLTAIVFGGAFGWIWTQLSILTTTLEQSDGLELEGWPEWSRTAVNWILETGAIQWTLGLGQIVVFLFVALLISWFCFSLIYELISGPFLDELHGRIEAEWFGRDPRNAISRPNDIPTSRCALLSVAWMLPAGLLIAAGLIQAGSGRWIWFGMAPLTLLGSMLADRRYGPWLGWVVALESRTLWVSARAALLSGVLLVAFLWLHLIPVVGSPIFFALSGFVTAISLLDIPISRRQWSLAQEFAFLRRHLGAVTVFGASAALLFLVPIIGPLIMVPTASVGGLWLLCQLETKDL
ncbi:MAG: hypothetical protein ACI835_001458 [Planctomycetota bacterium]|jgi:uncharacterized protein involved in cysteine biosynthesis